MSWQFDIREWHLLGISKARVPADHGGDKPLGNCRIVGEGHQCHKRQDRSSDCMKLARIQLQATHQAKTYAAPSNVNDSQCEHPVMNIALCVLLSPCCSMPWFCPSLPPFSSFLNLGHRLVAMLNCMLYSLCRLDSYNYTSPGIHKY